MDIKIIVGTLAGILTSISSVPQIVKVIRDKKAQAISPVMFFVLLAGNLGWTYYGTLLTDWPIICTNAFAAMLDVCMIILNYKYNKM
ncbi:MAG: SemiSWEET family transporter [Pedobacter sp.]|nr:SemiSWEET family transporter [Pedobacter sp.]MDQ8051714.1 SemiSWEET family transporter [Pedobacter sp.]